jgi:hypothetical protein
MRDTVLSILITQIPIAIACFWVAFEMRGIRRGIEDLARRLEEAQEPEQKPLAPNPKEERDERAA